MAKTKRFCSIDDCNKPYVARDLCQKHYGRYYRQGDPTVCKVRTTDRVCEAIIDGQKCGGKHTAKGFCSTHYWAFRNWGDPSIKRQPAKKPSKYRHIFRPEHPNANGSGMIAEHRFVLSEAIGRPLGANENVHHKNGDSLDNRIENLELWNTYQPAGQRVEDKVKFALEILALYAPDKLTTS